MNELLRDPAKVEGLQPAQLQALILQMSTLQAAMAAQLISTESVTDDDSDTLLTVDEAAERLGLSPDWLYRRTKELPFVVRIGRHVRFSSSGIERFVKQRVGR